MKQNILQYTNTDINQINQVIQRLNETVKKSTSGIERIRNICTTINSVFQVSDLIIGSVIRGLNKCQETYNNQAASERKLETVMQMRGVATDTQIESIKRLIDQQQQLGVVNERVQMIAARELATTIEQAESLEKLIPGMNDLLVLQHGLNATGQQAAAIGQVMSKALRGNTSDLVRMGVVLNETQQAVLRHGNEQQRAATLADAVAQSIGDVNRALAETPEGRLQKQAYAMDELRGHIGLLYTEIQNALQPTQEKIMGLIEKTVSFFENNRGVIIGFFAILGTTILMVGNFLEGFTNVLGATIELIGELSPLVIGLGTALGILVIALNRVRLSLMLQNFVLNILIMFERIAISTTKTWKAVQAAFNPVMALNPMVLIIAGIAILAGWIAFLITKYDEFGATLLLLTGPIGWFMNAIMAIRNNWDSIVKAFQADGILGGLKRIGTVLLDTILYPAQQLLELLSKIPGLEKLAGGGALKIADIRKGLDLYTPAAKRVKSSDPQPSIDTNPSGSNPPTPPPRAGLRNILPPASSQVGIASSTNGQGRNVTLSIGKFFENIVFNGSPRQNSREIERVFEECLVKALNAAAGAV